MFGFRGKGKGKEPADQAPVTGAPGGDAPAPAVSGSSTHFAAAPVNPVRPTPDQALRMLMDGNRAFTAGDEQELTHVTAKDLAGLQDGQFPIAAVVACADSRVPPSLIFGQGLGKLFIVRVAGNTVDERGLASLVYGVKALKIPLIMVLGHTKCGAVAAAQALVEGNAEPDPSLEAMINPILPAVLTARAKHPENLADAAVEENARRVAATLQGADPTMVAEIAAGRLKIVGAVKNLATGEVRLIS